MFTVANIMQKAKIYLIKTLNVGMNISLTLSVLLILIPMDSSVVASQERSLTFFNTHTKENLTVIYRRQGKYIPESLEKINYILRDHRTGDIHPIDPKLMDFLYDLQTEVGNHGEVHIISGYRSPATNQNLRQNSKGVAKGSLHMQGKALDFRLPGTDTAELRDVARKMKRGGVGYYKKSDFIQIDTGRVRYW